MTTTDAILDAMLAGSRLSDEDAVSLLESNDLIPLGQAANYIRLKKNPEPIVTYIVDRNINYTNVCVSGCRFCAFFRLEGEQGAYVLTDEQIGEKIAETLELGGSQILMQGGLHPEFTLTWYERLISNIKSKHNIHIHAFSPPEIIHIANLSGVSVGDTIRRLKDAGLDSIPGGGAEILADRARSIASPNKCSADEWIDVMRVAHKQGLRTTATMMFGHVETLAERVQSLRRIRDLQDETGGFTAFIPWTFQPDNTALNVEAKSGGFDYLRTLAVSRLYLDNVDNIQSSWVTQGPNIAQMSLYFGANDMGSTMMEENVVASAGVSFRMTEKDIRRLIEDAGMIPKQRNMRYEILK
jgi:cyclic dehypoxanthinyl futalosine synthase